MAAAKKGSPERVRYSGNDLFFDVKVGRRGGFVSSANGYMPDHVAAPERQGRLGISRSYFSVEVDGLAVQASEGDKASFISLAKKVVEDVMDQWPLEQERVMQGDSTGIRALVVTKTSDTVWVVDSPYGISGAGPGSLLLTVGDTCALLDVSANYAVIGKGKITAIATVTSTQATITFDTDMDGASTGTAGDVFVTCVPTGTSATDTSFGSEPHGLKSLVDVEGSFATFEGINHARWLAQKMTSTTIDETVLMELLMTIEARANINWRQDATDMLLVTTPGIWKAYGESLLGLRRFNAPQLKLQGGFNAVQVANSALIYDPWCPRGRVYAVYTPDTIFIDLMDFGKLSYQDSPQWKQASKRDAWEANYAVYWNWGAVNRNSHGVISGITDSTNFSPEY